MPTPAHAVRVLARRRAEGAVPTVHVHWFRWSRDDPFSGASLYACRCGVVRPAV